MEWKQREASALNLSLSTIVSLRASAESCQSFYFHASHGMFRESMVLPLVLCINEWECSRKPASDPWFQAPYTPQPISFHKPDPLPPLPLVRTPLQCALSLIQQFTPVIMLESSEYRSWTFNGSSRRRQNRLTLCCPTLSGRTEVVSVVCTLPGRTKAYTLVIIKNQSVSVWL